MLNTHDHAIICDTIPDGTDTAEQFEIEIDTLTESKITHFLHKLGETEENYSDKLSFYENVITKYCQHKIKTDESLNFYFQFCF